MLPDHYIDLDMCFCYGTYTNELCTGRFIIFPNIPHIQIVAPTNIIKTLCPSHPHLNTHFSLHAPIAVKSFSPLTLNT